MRGSPLKFNRMCGSHGLIIAAANELASRLCSFLIEFKHMAKKKSDQPEAPPEEQELVRRVDAMMSVEKPLEKALPEPPAPDKEPAIEPPTAPQLPPKLLKTIGASKSAKAKKAPKASSAPEAIVPSAADTVDSDDPPPERILKLHVSEDTASAEPADTADEPTAADPIPLQDPLEDTETDKAVDDIVANEADLQLAVDDATARRRTAEAEAQNQRGLLATIFTSFWTWLFILGVAGVAWAWFH
jgi:hypothetical protein